VVPFPKGFEREQSLDLLHYISSLMYSCFHPAQVAALAPVYDEESTDLADVEPLYIEDMDKQYPDEWIVESMTKGIVDCIASWRSFATRPHFPKAIEYTLPWIVGEPTSRQ
jgi:hypothetical protein